MESLNSAPSILETLGTIYLDFTLAIPKILKGETTFVSSQKQGDVTLLRSPWHR